MTVLLPYCTENDRIIAVIGEKLCSDFFIYPICSFKNKNVYEIK